MSNATYSLGLGVWVALPVLTFLLAAFARAGWMFTGWALQ